MSGNIASRLFNVEIIPPPGAWEGILQRLDTEFRPDEQILAAKLSASEIVPPETAWPNIIDRLHEDVQPRVMPARRTIIRRLTLVAAAAAVVAIALVYFLYPRQQQPDALAVVPAPTITPVNPDTANHIIPNVALAITGPPKVTVAPIRTGTRTERKAIPTDIEPETNDLPVPLSPPIDPNDYAAINVSAPLLRDANGKVIFDRELLTGNGNDYITVTAPNGEQTRISAKFLSLLTDLNEAERENYFDFFFESSPWKNRFREWRNKLMQNGAFAPAPTNFFDIVELKNLLEDN